MMAANEKRLQIIDFLVAVAYAALHLFQMLDVTAGNDVPPESVAYQLIVQI